MAMVASIHQWQTDLEQDNFTFRLNGRNLHSPIRTPIRVFSPKTVELSLVPPAKLDVLGLDRLVEMLDKGGHFAPQVARIWAAKNLDHFGACGCKVGSRTERKRSDIRSPDLVDFLQDLHVATCWTYRVN